MAQTLRADRVIDVGCGTGLLCSQFAASGHRVLGVDPQATMLDLARAQPYASDVTWIRGKAKDLLSGWADLVVMTGQVAQYFLDDEAWRQVLVHAHRSLRSGGQLAFEVRNSTIEEWRKWPTEQPTATAAGTLETEVRRDGDL